MAKLMILALVCTVLMLQVVTSTTDICKTCVRNGACLPREECPPTGVLASSAPETLINVLFVMVLNVAVLINYSLR
ncbi:Uncharacterised protein r2_g379 [Pycnogonum litorale]